MSEIEKPEPEKTAEKLSDNEEFLLTADLGTTTLAFLCADENGRVIASYGCINPQRKYAADVIGRVDYACRNGAESLNHEVKEALVQGFLFVLKKAEEVCGRRKLLRFGIAGNTVMLHLLLNETVQGFFGAPFQPVRLDGKRMYFSELFGKEVGIDGELVILPGFSAFVGADLFAGAYLLDFYKENQSQEDLPETEEAKEGKKTERLQLRTGRTQLLADFGTNGEILLLHEGKLFATSSAMGTAFEGGRFSYAADLFRLIAEARREKKIDEYGLLSEPYFSEGYHGLWEEDVRGFQLAKGAVRAGIELLLMHAGTTAKQVERVFLAGGLGQFCSIGDLLETGLLPTEFSGKVALVGNSSLGGTLLYLRKREVLRHCEAKVINLAECPEFEEYYYAHMNFEA